MTRRTITTSFLLQAALAALLLSPGPAAAGSSPFSTDEARRLVAADVAPAAPAPMAPSGPIASTDLARAATIASLQPSQAVRHARPAGPIQSTDHARALAAARSDAAVVATAASVAR